jgi:hypothetical protein
LHSVKKLRIDRVTDIGGTYTITLQFIATDHHDNEGALELTLFDPPLDQMLKLYLNFKDADTHWLGEDFLEMGDIKSNPIAIAAAKILAEDGDHIGG